MSIYLNDLYFTIDGDFLASEVGDVKDLNEVARNDDLIYTKQFIIHRLIAGQNAWSLHPNLCAGLEQFIGSIINPSLLSRLETLVHYILTFDGMIESSLLSVKAIDLGAGTEAIILMIYLTGLSETPVTMISFDVQNGQISQVK